MHPNVIQEANKLDRHIDLPMWLSCLSLEDKAVPFYQQKELECQFLEKQINGTCPKGSYSSRDHDISALVDDKDKKQIYKLMDDLISRVEIKNLEEKQITKKINAMRNKLRSSSQSQEDYPVVKLFEVSRK